MLQRFDSVIAALIVCLNTLSSEVYFCMHGPSEMNGYVSRASDLTFILSFLRLSFFQFSLLIDLFAVDHPDRESRFEVCYLVFSTLLNFRILIKVQVLVTECVDSVGFWYASASWLEREIWDLFGVMFLNHSDLRRILTDYGFVGHPMRKDYPLSGFTELRYQESVKRVIFEPVEFTQAYRYFDFRNPWI